MEPWQSWLIVILASITAWFYYTKQSGSSKRSFKYTPIFEDAKGRPSRRRENVKAKQPRVSNRSAASGSDTPVLVSAATSGSPSTTIKQLRKRKTGNKPPEPAVVSSAVEPSGTGVDTSGTHVSEAMDNKEFAKQLSSLKTGTNLAPPAPTRSNKNPTRSNKKSKKKSHVEAKSNNNAEWNNASSSQVTSTTSSSGGMDADDDLSLSNSPAFGATSTDRARKTGDISDMLEAPAAGPSVLRLTDPNQKAPQKQPKQQKTFQVQETKKQRQNRQKTDTKKVAREQAEKERRILLEKQLRTAREAEGRPAKDGTASSKAPITSAWTTPVQPTSSHDPVPAVTQTTYAGPLLDTFDNDNSAKAQIKESGRSDIAEAAKAWERDLPSEEDQMRMIKEMNGDDGWKTVEKRRKRKNTSGSVTATNSESSDAGSVSAQTGPAAAVSPPGHPSDSDWAVV
ncbi:hypothetical protein MMC16_007469 [Acarospora aff. strigata]|nr:hypothetical protein [Acarospora aff. strigata]